MKPACLQLQMAMKSACLQLQKADCSDRFVWPLIEWPVNVIVWNNNNFRYTYLFHIKYDNSGYGKLSRKRNVEQ